MKTAAPVETSEYYQWPAPDAPAAFKRGAAAKREAPRIRSVERFFEEKLGAPAVLMPSARAGLSMILKVHGINRAHLVQAPKWSSYCVWAIIGRYANPTISFDGPLDVIVPVHTWGRVHALSRRYPALVIEDSVDTLFTDARTLFPNGGAYELLSLPKIVASYCGGVVLAKDAAAAERLRATRAGGDGFAAQQSYLKYLWAKGRSTEETRFQDWYSTEWSNTGFDENALAHIEECLGRYDERAAVIRRRLDAALREKPRLAAYYDADSGRLPPVLAIPVEDCGEMAPAPWQTRHKNCGSADRPEFKTSYLLPLHFKTPEPLFERLLAALKL